MKISLHAHDNLACRTVPCSGHFHVTPSTDNLPGITLQIQNLFWSPSMCEKLTHHWLDGQKDRWLYNKPDGLCDSYSEMFDGHRWTDYSYFFDPHHEFLLPALCAQCGKIFLTGYLLAKTGISELEVCPVQF